MLNCRQCTHPAKKQDMTEESSITIKVHIKPNAKVTELLGYHGDAIKIALKAPPVDGKANAALITALAKWFGVTKSQVSILRGHTARTKIVQIDEPKHTVSELLS